MVGRGGYAAVYYQRGLRRAGIQGIWAGWGGGGSTADTATRTTPAHRRTSATREPPTSPEPRRVQTRHKAPDYLKPRVAHRPRSPTPLAPAPNPNRITAHRQPLMLRAGRAQRVDLQPQTHALTLTDTHHLTPPSAMSSISTPTASASLRQSTATGAQGLSNGPQARTPRDKRRVVTSAAARRLASRYRRTHP